MKQALKWQQNVTDLGWPWNVVWAAPFILMRYELFCMWQWKFSEFSAVIVNHFSPGEDKQQQKGLGGLSLDATERELLTSFDYLKEPKELCVPGGHIESPYVQPHGLTNGLKNCTTAREHF